MHPRKGERQKDEMKRNWVARNEFFQVGSWLKSLVFFPLVQVFLDQTEVCWHMVEADGSQALAKIVASFVQFFVLYYYL